MLWDMWCRLPLGGLVVRRSGRYNVPSPAPAARAPIVPQSVPYLIDGSNLLGFLPGLRHDSDRDRRMLVRRLLRSPELRRRGLTVVFDGEPEGGPRRVRLGRRTEVRFSGGRSDADTVIRDLLDRASPNRFVLVTDDRELRDHASSRGFRSIPCLEMARLLSREDRRGTASAHDANGPPGRDEPLGEEEVRDWLDWFRKQGED